MKVGLIDIILIILFFQLLSLIPFLLSDNKTNKFSNKILAAFLFAKAICISNFLSFSLYDVTFNYFPHLFHFGSSFTILWGPLLYFYTKSLTDNNFKFRKQDAFHLIPFAVHFLLMFLTFHMYSVETKRTLLSDGGPFSPAISALILGIVHITILIYTVASFRVIFKYRSEIKESLSSVSSVNLSWMVFVLAGFTAKWIFDVIYIIQNDLLSMSGDVPLYISRFLLFLFINIMLFKGLKQPGIFSGLLPVPAVKKPFLSKSLQEEYLGKLLQFMEEEKPYLEPNLTLIELSEKISIPHRSLSEVINNVIGTNFYDFINSYRIKESQKLLSENSSENKTILEVIYEVGYNSKSSFNIAFKKFTGMTPSEYKKLCQN